MVKKLKTMTKQSAGDSQLAAAVKDSAQQIWLAGLGAFSKAQEEGGKVFDVLVKEGNSIQKRTMRMTEDKVNEVTGTVSKLAGEFQKTAKGNWDKLEGVFEQRVERALTRLGVPSSREISELTHRVEALTASVKKMTATKTSAAKRAVAKSAAKPAAKRAAKAAAKPVAKAPRRRPAAKKAVVEAVAAA